MPGSRGELHTSRLPGAPIGRDRERADRQADAEPRHASVEPGDVRSDHDVRRPHRRREEDEEQPERRCRRSRCRRARATPAIAKASATALRRLRVATAATAIGPMNSIVTALAEIDAVDAEVEEQVHQRGRDAEQPGGERVRSASSVRRQARDTTTTRDRGADDPEPGDGLGFDLVEQRDGDDRADVLRRPRTARTAPRAERCSAIGDRAGRRWGGGGAGLLEQFGFGTARSRPTSAGS